MREKRNMKAQVSMFVIIGILIVAGVSAVIFINSQIQEAKWATEEAVLRALPERIRPVESSFLDCLKEISTTGTNTLGLQAGYIELPEKDEASDFMPFSSHFQFIGTAIPYWFYISGNNLQKMQMPSIESMQNQLNNYIKENAARCSVLPFIAEGFEISEGEISEVSSRIRDDGVDVIIDLPLTIAINKTSATVQKHAFKLPFALGKTYKLARDIMSYENETLFLEERSIDVLALYAPTSGFELICSPKTWFVDEVESTVKEALEGNIAFLKLKGNYFDLAKKENKYFVLNLDAKDMNINFLSSREWPSKFEVYPSENGVMSAEPIGKQEMLAAATNVLGLCFLSYQFTYDLAYPVLVQVYDSKTNYIFQFPIVVSVYRNKPRTAELISIPQYEREICLRKVQPVTIETYDNKGNPLEADISFKCISTVCEIGQTKLSDGIASLTENFPQCVNGFIIASADGYAEKKYQISTNQETSAVLFLQPFKSLDLDFNVEEDSSVFLSVKLQTGDYATTIIWPEQKQIQLIPGTYDVRAWAMKKGSFTLKGETIEKCNEVPALGIAGLFGAKREQCTNYEIPEITMSEAPYGGATLEFSVSESDLEDASKIKFNLNIYDVPKNQAQLQEVYEFIGSASAQAPELE